MAWYNRCSFSSLHRVNKLRQGRKSELVNQRRELRQLQNIRRRRPPRAANSAEADRTSASSQALRRFQQNSVHGPQIGPRDGFVESGIDQNSKF
jgi:hypothetical protein